MPALPSEPLTERLHRRLAELRWSLRASAALDAAGVRAWLVGGFIRDVASGRSPLDIDAVVDAEPLAVAADLSAVLDGRVVPLDPERGVVRIVLPDGATLDLTPLRGGSIEADLGGRDFTVNAVAVPFAGLENEPVDPFGGLTDLALRRLRLVSARAFREDGLRLMRAARLATDLDLSLDPDLVARARADASRIGEASPERRRDELVRLLSTDHAARGLRTLDRLGVLDHLLPEVAAGRGVSQPKEHYFDVLDHSIETVGALDCLLSPNPPLGRAAERLRAAFRGRLDPIVNIRAYFDERPVAGRDRAALTKLSGLLHDIGKPDTKALDETGRTRFFGHAELGAERSAAILSRLRFSNREIAFVRTLVEEHLRPTQLSSGGPPTDRALGRYFRDLGEVAFAALVLSLADHMAARGPKLDERDYAAHLAYVAYVLDRRRSMLASTPRKRLVTGDDLMAEFDLPPGPIIGRLLRAVEEAQDAGEIRTRPAAMELAGRTLTAAGQD